LSVHCVESVMVKGREEGGVTTVIPGTEMALPGPASISELEYPEKVRLVLVAVNW
jgi:hypothetical protein